MPDLRSFIDVVRRERPRDVLDVHRKVSPRYETAAIVTKLEQASRFPIVVFHDVAGTPFPLVSNVCASPFRIAMALGCSPRDMSRRYAEGCMHPVRPQLKECGRVQEQAFSDRDVDLRTLPQLVYHEGDAEQPYITGAIVIARDPDSGKSNLSFHRLMITSRNTTTIFMARGKHLESIFRKYERREEPMPIAAFIGVHPACSLGALYTGAADVEEYDIIGGLLGEPLPVVRCLTNALEVPAEAEVVLEGKVLPSARIEEGPFGEFTGYATGTAFCPTFLVDAITCRKNAIFQDIVSGRAEHLLLPLTGMEHHLLTIAKRAVPSTTAIRISVPLTVFVAVEKRSDDDPRRLIQALINSDIYVKHVIVVDTDVDINDLRQVATAVALHACPEQDTIVTKGPSTELDPSCAPTKEHTTKIGIDATVALNSRRSIRKNRVPQQVFDSIELSELLQAS